MEPYPRRQFGFIENPDRQFGNGLVWTRTRTRSDGPEPLLTLVVTFARQTWECIGLLNVTLDDITLDSPVDTDQSAGRDEQRAAAVVAAEEPLQGDT